MFFFGGVILLKKCVMLSYLETCIPFGVGDAESNLGSMFAVKKGS